tara:strand:- start:20196 stop:21833 length:1638 start_codon:yes stop_codon:yes gene_type:complete
MKNIFFVLILGLLFSTNAQQINSPKLVVGIVIDQMCYDYIYRYSNKFCDKGFKELILNGFNCRNTQYNYIPTYTGPGHASIYTGTTPSNHGIVGNDWYDRDKNKLINCVEDSAVKPVGTSSIYGFCSPINLKTNTITDQLKMTYPNSKVISMSIKNRGAILPGGHLSDGSYWYDYDTGDFITSTFFKEQMPDWVKKFNEDDFIEKQMKGEWNTILDMKEYVESRSDNSKYEHLLPGKKTPTFPYDLNFMSQIGNKYELFVYTPFANNYLTDFAIESIDNEGLGKDGQTDMLCISYSTPDILGHAFGPYSVEIEDMYIRLDLEIKKLIDNLNKKVGEDNFVLFLTADHAVVPVPQYLIDNKLPGGYFFIDECIKTLRDSVIGKYGEDLVLIQKNLNIYLNHNRINDLKLDRIEVSKFVAKLIQEFDAVKSVYTADQLYSNPFSNEILDMVSKGYHYRESGDVIFTLEPGYLPKSTDSHLARRGTSHGSAYSYDTHVPLLWYGKNIPVGEVFRKIIISDISATLAHILYIQNPNSLTGKPILELFKK